MESVVWSARPTLRVCFTPDEEVGRGADHFDVERFGAQDIPKDSIEARLVEIRQRHPRAVIISEAHPMGPKGQKAAGICYVKVDGMQLTITGGCEAPITEFKRESIVPGRSRIGGRGGHSTVGQPAEALARRAAKLAGRPAPRLFRIGDTIPLIVPG